MNDEHVRGYIDSIRYDCDSIEVGINAKNEQMYNQGNTHKTRKNTTAISHTHCTHRGRGRERDRKNDKDIKTTKNWSRLLNSFFFSIDFKCEMQSQRKKGTPSFLLM